MGKDKGYCPKSETREIIISGLLKGDSSPFFYDVRNTREEGLVLLLDKDFNANDAERMCREHSRGGEVKVNWNPVVSVRSYLDWFSGWGEKTCSPGLIDARDALRRHLQQEGYPSNAIFEGIAIKEVGQLRGVVDMAVIDRDVLSLYNIAQDLGQVRRKRVALSKSSLFFKEHFGDVLSVAGCFLVDYNGRKKMDIQEFVIKEWMHA